MVRKFDYYKCSSCGRKYNHQEVVYTCPEDGGNLDIVLDYKALQGKISPDEILENGERSLWRYLTLLPVGDPGGMGTPLRCAGWTPVHSPVYLRERSGLRNLWIKDESGNPTASFKDRASAVVVARAREINADVVVTASTGNAGAALAGMSAAVGQKAVIFAPQSAPPAKIAQLLIYGAQVLLVDGTYDDAFDLSIEAASEFGWYCRNTGYNPFTVEGKKTAAFEIWEWWLKKNPAHAHDMNMAVFVSVGDGNIISGLHKGFKDLFSLGWIETIPHIYGVQAQGSAAIANAFISGSESIESVSANTLADSISVDFPRDGVRALRAVGQTGGEYIKVSDEEILGSISDLGRAGIFAEPAGATAYAGVVKALRLGKIKSTDHILAINTGSGLKDVNAAMRAGPKAQVISPSLEDVKRAIEAK